MTHRIPLYAIVLSKRVILRDLCVGVKGFTLDGVHLTSTTFNLCLQLRLVSVVLHNVVLAVLDRHVHNRVHRYPNVLETTPDFILKVPLELIRQY